MCIVVDKCAIPPVFNAEDMQHEEFKPVLKWIEDRDGKLIYGGSTYIRELSDSPRYLSIVVELSKIRKAILLDRKDVDDYEEDLKREVADAAFDDAHIVAIVAVSGCKLVCTLDTSSLEYLGRNELYPKHIQRPRFYTGARNAGLLCKKYVAKICKRID